ncbi:hypothetical protein [Aeromonas enteropelogenes]|uniref:hypothetical protein n=1 Tax=Aeromonas enteropelogenes TaxID=29489 RepID=UPI003BA02B38
MQEIEFDAEGRKSKWWGYGDYYCISPHGTKIYLPYECEPPHGDSFHHLIINSKSIRGYVWCGYFLWSECGRYFTCDWFEGMRSYQKTRATIVVAPEELIYRIVLDPAYSEVHSTLREAPQRELWKILLSKEGLPWKKFC